MMRTLLISAVSSIALATAAFAADLPNIKAPAPFMPPPPPVFSWTGFYIGGQVGYEWGRSGNSYYAPSGLLLGSGHHDDEGVIGGGHVGYNYEIGGFGIGGGGFVVGIEGDVNGSSYSGSGKPSVILTNRDRTDVDGSVRGRVGIAFDRVLVYGTGGVAFASIRNSVSNSLTGGYDSLNTGRIGWTAGGGIEYAIDNNWSVRAEYRYTDFGSYDFALPNSTLRLATDHVRETDNRVQAGFSYKFDFLAPPVPVVAKY